MGARKNGDVTLTSGRSAPNLIYRSIIYYAFFFFLRARVPVPSGQRRWLRLMTPDPHAGLASRRA